MPTLVDAETDERNALLQYLEAQRGALRRAVYGLTDEQAAARPSASALCLGGLIKHVARTERRWVSVLITGRPDPTPATEETWHLEFGMAEGETVADVLREYDEVARETEEIVNGLPDLEMSVPLPEAPWFPPNSRRTVRWVLLHMIEETARHAGHADIIRESLDGATAFELVAAAGR